MNPSFLRGSMRLAELYEDAHRYRDAADAYAAAQSAAGTRGPDLTPQRATALLNAGDPAGARGLLEKRLAETPSGSSSLLFLLGQAQRQVKDTAGATATSEKLKADFPGDPRGLYLGAQVLVDAGRLKEALSAYQDLLKLAPANTSIVYSTPICSRRTASRGRPNARSGICWRRTRSTPTRSTSLATCCAERGERLDEAVDLVQRALEVDPGNPSYLDSLGWAYFRRAGWTSPTRRWPRRRRSRPATPRAGSPRRRCACKQRPLAGRRRGLGARARRRWRRHRPRRPSSGSCARRARREMTRRAGPLPDRSCCRSRSPCRVAPPQAPRPAGRSGDSLSRLSRRRQVAAAA